MNVGENSDFEEAIDQLCLSYMVEDGPDCYDAAKIDIAMTWVPNFNLLPLLNL